MTEFKERLYEATVYAFGKILAKYNVFAQGAILREVGKEVLEYLERHGFDFRESGTLKDIHAATELFVRNGFCDKLDTEPAEKGEKYVWYNIYGFDAYKELLDITQNPFLSCPLNAVLSYLASKYGKTLHLREKTFDEKEPIIVSVEELVDMKDSEVTTDDGIDPAVIENARLYALAEERAKELEKVLGEIKTLRGMLPICAHCKKIRDDQGYWNRIERYIEDRSDAKFTHGLCPDCLTELYPEVAEFEKNKRLTE